ncbi:MAG: MFS transporter [Dehalococcoidia bacterium]
MSHSSWYHRRPTLLPGRAVRASRLVLARAVVGGFFNSMAFALYALYVVRDAELSPFELVIVGTLLEGSVFLFEIPTGIVADAFSRRLSVLTGTVLMGLSPLVMGLYPSFEGIMAGQFLLGVGFTFISGAQEAWLADEVGEDEAARLYPRVAQWRLTAGVTGVLAAVGLGLWSHSLPFIVGGAGYALMAVPLAMTMTEGGWAPAPREERGSWGRMAGTARTGLGVATRRPMVRAALAVAFLLGFSSEAFDRLWGYRLIEEIGLPDGVDEVLLFGGIQLLVSVGGIAALRVGRRLTRDGSRASASRLLSVTYALIGGTVLAFALVTPFWAAVALVLAVGWVRTVEAPFRVAWVNRGLDPATRATVLSAIGQADSIGQVGSGPVFASIAGGWGARAALALGALVVLPAVGLVRTRPLEEREARKE